MHGAAGLLVALVLAGSLLALGVSLSLAPGARGSSNPQTGTTTAGVGSLSFQPVLGLPATHVALIGASPQEAAGATWAQGELSATPALVGGQSLASTETLLRYTSQSGAWQVVPVDDSGGASLDFDWWGSEVTVAGGVLLAGDDSKKRDSVVTRDPGGAFAEAPVPIAGEPAASSEPVAGEASEEQVLQPGETLLPSGEGKPVIAALEEADGGTGALVVPVRSEATQKLAPVVLHYDGSRWTRESVCESYEKEECEAADGALTPLAISASSPTNAWLAVSTSAEPLVLYHRVAEPGGTEAWVRRHPASWMLGTGSAPLPNEKATPLSAGPLLTAVGQGVWVDVQILLGTSTGTSTGDGTVLVSTAAAGEVAGSFCYPTSMCPGDGSLGAALPSDYSSFAWAGSGVGTRIITGLEDGAMLILEDGGEFAYTVGDGAGGGSRGAVGPGGETLEPSSEGSSLRTGGAAFASPSEGWLGFGGEEENEPAPQAIHVTEAPTSDALSSWPVPFRRPLLAIAGEPGTTPGEANAEALAVGEDGEVARYMPGEGWTPEYLYNGNGEREAPTLRGVAWPEPGHAYAVGDEGAMWLWLSATGLWEPDPATPFGFHGNMTAIAFEPGDPNVGYAVGKQGVMLAYDKTWTQEALPPGLSEANFTSISFAGKEAIATYRVPEPENAGHEEGGLIVNNGSGWQVEPAAQKLLESLPNAEDTILSKVAGLPSGGAVAAGPNVVIERESTTSSWHLSSERLAEAEEVAAVSAVQEGSTVRALVAFASKGDLYENVDNPPPPAAGQPKLLIGPDPLPERSYLLRETASGWEDVGGNDQPAVSLETPEEPESVLALLIDPDGDEGWAVGGQTGEWLAEGEPGAVAAVQTAAAMRFGAGPAPPVSEDATIATPSGQATFALGGDAQCVQKACADFAREDPGADTWLSAAIARAADVHGLHAFLYAGPHLASAASKLEAGAFERELASYASLLQSPGSLPVYAAVSSTDVGANSDGTEAFAHALGTHVPAGEVPEHTPKPPEGDAAYAFNSAGEGDTVRVIVLDYSQSTLAPSDTSTPSCPSDLDDPANQLQWLCAQLQDARAEHVPAIVLGNRSITDASASNYARDASAVEQVLLEQGASAYLFESPEENVSETIGTGADTIPAYGSGTLGYVTAPRTAGPEEEFHGASGFLLVSVDVAARETSNRAPVSATLAVNAGQLAIDATNGTFLRRSQVALFEGLARRPAGGGAHTEGSKSFYETEAPDPYTTLPERCVGSSCNTFVEPTYTFTSSNPDIGDFVEQNPDSTNAREPLVGANGKPVLDSHSGLFCAYNAGTTDVTVSAGGLSYSMPVTVQEGSVEEPCGTVPLVNPPAAEEEREVAALPPSTPVASSPGYKPLATLAPPPLPKAPAVKPHLVHHKPAPRPHQQPPPVPAALFPNFVLVPPPAPSLAQPTPPSGTAQVPVQSPVAQQMSVAEREREDESATEHVQNMAAYEQEKGNPLPTWPLGLIVVAALAAAGARPRRDRQRPVYAWARTRRRGS